MHEHLFSTCLKHRIQPFVTNITYFQIDRGVIGSRNAIRIPDDPQILFSNETFFVSLPLALYLLDQQVPLSSGIQESTVHLSLYYINVPIKNDE